MPTVTGKQKTRWVIPASAGIISIAFLWSRLSTESIDSATSRFSNAFISRDSKTLFSFMHESEKKTLQMNEKQFGKLMEFTLFREYSPSRSTDVQIKRQGNARIAIFQNLNESSGLFLPVEVVGTDGKYFVPGFVELCLQAAAVKRFSRTKPSDRFAGFRIVALYEYLQSNMKELELIGIQASYDYHNEALTPFSTRVQNLKEKITKMQRAK
jgi:hypothetical protein